MRSLDSREDSEKSNPLGKIKPQSNKIEHMRVNGGPTQLGESPPSDHSMANQSAESAKGGKSADDSNS